MPRVLDFTRVLAGPWATQILGDQGFEVVKVESLAGDETRTFLPHRDGASVYFACTNRNKRSIALDLARPEGRAVALRLAERADVVLENFRPGVLDRLGLGWDVLSARNPRLVYVSISAFGPADGTAGAERTVPPEWAGRAGYDLVLQSLGAIAGLTADPPRKAGPSIADLASAYTAVQAVLFALLERAETGRGKRVDISMLEVQHHLLAYYASSWLNAGRAPAAPSNAHPSIAPYNLYACADGWLSICCANDALWEKLRVALALPALPEWSTLPGRVADRARLDATITAALSADTVAAWDARLSAAGVPCGAALSVPDSLALPIARTVAVGPWTFPAPPLPPRQLTPPPRLGEHTDAVLAELGMSPAEIEALVAAGVAARG